MNDFFDEQAIEEWCKIIDDHNTQDCVLSDDDDFVPPLLALSVTNVKNNIVRLSPKGQVGTRRFGYKIPNLINECL